MDIALWAAQILLAGVFLGSGVVKSIWPKDRVIASGQTGVAPFPQPVIRLVAAAELCGAAGLIAPWATGIAPLLTPAAAIGLSVVMIGALISHSALLRADRRAGRGSREARNLAVNTVILALCLFVAIGRL
ncbi:DoxX family protein [Sphaerisporangium aureirubrum]|uniref:DoxX family protein n=1 Tax=Sphaerisporangium aureirubrum TaxID=1544736 RepID=A0ABW1NRH7_9ACTN